MTSNSTVHQSNRPSSVLGISPVNYFLNLLRRILLASTLVSTIVILLWLPGLSITASAMPINSTATPGSITSQGIDSAADGDRISALIDCLPKQLSQPSFKRAWSEMGDDQLQRAFNLKPNPKLSQAEIELKNCLDRQGAN